MTAVLSPVVLFAVRRAGMLDVPTARSSHSTPVPRGGGVAPAIGAVIALAFAPMAMGDARVALVLVAATFGTIGLVEDLVGIPPRIRLGLQALAAAAALPWILSGLHGDALWETVFAVGVAVWLVAYVNSFNFMDGIDGISVAQAMVAGLTWYVVGRGEHVVPFAVGGIIIAGAAAGFAPFNFPTARLFLGDSGSYFFGGWLAAVAVLGLRAGVAPEAVLAPLALYVADTALTLSGRIRRREVWYLPHRSHVYQRLVQGGWSHVRTTLAAAATIAACSALGVASLSGSLLLRVVADATMVLVVVAYLSAPSRLVAPGGQLAEDRG
jgi:UDP-N-acetylmuramyl pentapeptide phosphotransferase/UDP-N-acetylglucosamine-1-phosphate transferase